MPTLFVAGFCIAMDKSMPAAGQVGTVGALPSAILVFLLGIGAGCDGTGATSAAESSSSETSTEVTELSAPRELPPRTTLVFWVDGGIEGLAHELRVTTDDRAELRVFGELSAEVPLDAREAEELHDLVERARPLRATESDPPDTADGMGSGILFDGKGSSDLDHEISTFASTLFETLRSVAEVASQQVVLIGRAEEDARRGRWTLAVEEVLVARREVKIEPGSELRLVSFGPQHAKQGSRVWGLVVEESRKDGVATVGFWRQAAIDLAPRIRAVVEQSTAR